ncbi:MAG: PQQ-binding-like beta-propeller repeat protein [Acidobacteriota bacterium]|nr:PQQ-binding-like beta-propeller repeat protein [Acidobacteriota bacterium]
MLRTASARRIAFVTFALVACSEPRPTPEVGPDSDWRHYNGNLASWKYSPLDQIDSDNVGSLEVAWRRPAVDESRLRPDQDLPTSLRSTPLKVGSALYISNAWGLVEAFDAGTGATIWVERQLEEPGSGARSRGKRGVAYWENGEDRRILSISGEHLIALAAETGAPALSFGKDGRVDLSEGIGPPRVRYRWTGVPLVVGDVVIVGSSMTDDPPVKRQPPGDVRAYDVRSGELLWTFHVIPREGEPGTETWEEESWRYSGHANLWTLMSADEESGYVYLPLSSPTGDMYGGHRLGDNLYGQSLVCVEATTGRRVWHQQLVHHGLWDYDLPAAPVLADIVVDGEPVKAVVQITKQAFTFVFDRLTGEPVWPIKELPVPRSNVPGERTAPTQPFPTRPPPFDRQGVAIDDLIDFTPELRTAALEIAGRYVIGPMFTPPSVRGDALGDTLGTLQLPGSQGGADVQGAAYDPDTGWLYVPSITVPFAADVVAGDPGRTDLRYRRGTRQWVPGPEGLPLLKPPYGRITAIDLNRGEHVWMVPNGDGPRDHPLLAGLDLPPLGSPGRAAPLVTKTLLFIGEGSSGRGGGGNRVPEGMSPNHIPGGGANLLRAYDKESGEVVWRFELGARATGAPMTYLHQGRQYLVVAVGGPDAVAGLVALALPVSGTG